MTGTGTKSPHCVVLNDYSDVLVEERERKSGKKHVTLSIKSTPIAVNLDPIALGRGPANALAEVIRKQIAGIGDMASEATQLSRKYASNAFARGEAWATKRYAGGRTGAKPPNQSSRKYNDSGRLAGSIVAMANEREGSWTINCAASRLDASSFKGGAAGEAFQSMVRGLVDRVPALSKPLDQPEVNAAIISSLDAAIKVDQGRLVDAGRKSRMEIARLVVDVLQAGARVMK
jgi:hypothetical protein